MPDSISDPSPVNYDNSGTNQGGNPITAITLTAPSPAQGSVNTDSGLFVLQLVPNGGTTNLTIVCTPFAKDASGNTVSCTFTPSTVTLSQSTPSGTFKLNSPAALSNMKIGITHTSSVSGGTGGTGP